MIASRIRIVQIVAGTFRVPFANVSKLQAEFGLCDKWQSNNFVLNRVLFLEATCRSGSRQAFTPTGVTAISRWFAFKAHHRSDGIECDSILKGSQRLRQTKVAVIPSGSNTGIRRFPGVSLRLPPGYLLRSFQDQRQELLQDQTKNHVGLSPVIALIAIWNKR